MTVSPSAMPGARPIPAAPGGLAALAVNETEDADFARRLAAADLPGAGLFHLPAADRPTPAVMPPTAPRSGPLYGIQFLRKEAVRLAIDSYRDTDRPTDEQLLATADVLAEFIRGGHLPDNPKKAR